MCIQTAVASASTATAATTTTTTTTTATTTATTATASASGSTSATRKTIPVWTASIENSIHINNRHKPEKTTSPHTQTLHRRIIRLVRRHHPSLAVAKTEPAMELQSTLQSKSRSSRSQPENSIDGSGSSFRLHSRSRSVRSMRSISFHEHVLVRPVLLPLDEYSEEEHRLCWLNQEDYKAIHAEALVSLKKSFHKYRRRRLEAGNGNSNVNGNVNGNDWTPPRGLERWALPRRTASLKRRMLALEAVLGAQAQHKQQQKTNAMNTTTMSTATMNTNTNTACCAAASSSSSSDAREQELAIREAYQKHAMVALDLARAMGTRDALSAWGRVLSASSCSAGSGTSTGAAFEPPKHNKQRIVRLV